MGFLAMNIAGHYGEIREDLALPAIVAFPTIVNEVLSEFGPLFDNEPKRRHFAEYLTGLIIAHRKNVSAINREFVSTTDQSCLNRWLTEVPWDPETLNQRRIDWAGERRYPVQCSWGVMSW
jgi:hypothetical protein